MHITIFVFVLEMLFIPQESWANEMIDELKLRGISLVRFTNIQPYNLDEVMENKGKFEATPENRILQQRLGYFDTATPQVRLCAAGNFLSDTVTRYFQNVGLLAALPKLDFCIEPYVKFGTSEEYPDWLWKDIVAGDLHRAYGHLKLGAIDVLLGRESLRWGPLSGNSLMISGTSPPFDLLYASYQYKFFKGSFFCTALDPSTLPYDYITFPQGDTFPAGTYNRFFSGHRVDFSLFGDKLLVGLSEVVLYSGDGISFMPTYLNPFMLFYISKHNWKDNAHTDNVGWGFDFSYYLGGIVCLFGELFIDDAQYESSPDNIPHMLAYRIGLKGVWARSFWTLQYTRVDTWTYIHPLYWNNFLYRGYPIGHSQGQDLDEVSAKLTNHINYQWDILVDIAFRRKGANNYDNHWPGVFSPEQKFPSGIVEKSISVNVGLRFFYTNRIFVEAITGYDFHYNYQHDEDENKSFPSLKLSYNLIIY
jgi:hypothetical protein